MQTKEGYYAALERQSAGEASLRSRFDGDAEGRDLDQLERLYADVGVKAFSAFNNCLDWLSQIGGQRPTGSHESRETAFQERLLPALNELKEAFEGFQERLGRVEGSIAALDAGMRRIDKYTLEAFRSIKEVETRALFEAEQSAGSAQTPEYRGRLAKEEAASLAIEAAQRMRAEGRRISLAAVAREAGLKYGQIVYAFGNKEGFLDALQAEQSEDVSGYRQDASA